MGRRRYDLAKRKSRNLPNKSRSHCPNRKCYVQAHQSPHHSNKMSIIKIISFILGFILGTIIVNLFFAIGAAYSPREKVVDPIEVYFDSIRPPRCPFRVFATGTTEYELEIRKEAMKSVCPNLYWDY